MSDSGQRPELRTADFDYHLPTELIAQFPAERRSDSRMLVVPPSEGAVEHRRFTDFASCLQPGDCLVMNDSKVLAARLFGVKEGGSARFEALLLREDANGEWLALLRPGKRAKSGVRVRLDHTDAWYEVTGRAEDGLFRLRFSTPDVEGLLEQVGHMPLPPYIGREDVPDDRVRYQTVYARVPGSVAAPTAGLHFTDEVLAGLRERGVRLAYVTLHVGLGTFRPVAAENLADHTMHEETYLLPAAEAATINGTREAGGRVIAIGTTSVRVLESCAMAGRKVAPGSGATRLFMHPPYEPRVVDGLLTNFHLPCSTLMMLVSCFRSRERVLAAYEEAVRERYRFYSYGDCMFLPPR